MGSTSRTCKAAEFHTMSAAKRKVKRLVNNYARCPDAGEGEEQTLMALVTTEKMLKDAQAGHYAVGAFNVENLEFVMAVLAAAEETKSPVIMQTTSGTIKKTGLDYFYGMVKAAAERASVPVALHLDHGDGYDRCMKALRAGYTSVMIDGSHETFEDNIALTRKVVEYAHDHGVRVHVTVNTMPRSGEVDALPAHLERLNDAGVDALILADLGAFTLAGKYAPRCERHISTQQSIANYACAQAWYDLGAKRVVLARELSLPEVEHITRHCGIETECFVHGALCMCVSGQCYMSAFLGGRSGNRGSCAGPCRLPFEANSLPEGKPGRLHHLSLKDNSVIDKLDKLQAIGVASAKIEGRLRTPEYVAAAVSACLAGREGRAYDRDLLKNAFSRSGFTSGYLDGKIDGTMFGVRSEADAELTRKTLPALRELYRRERSRVPVEMKIEIEEGGEKLTVTDGTNKAFAYGDAEPQPARTDPTESLSRSLSKTGGTPFSAEKIDVEMDGGPWFVPGSAINELRREALDALLKKRETLRPWPVNEVELPPLPLRTLPPHRTLRTRFERWEQVPEQALSGVEYLILPIAQADRVPREWREKTLLELPRVMFGALEEDTARRIAATQDAGFAGYEVSNIAHLRLCRGLPMAGGFGLNVTNNLAAQYYADLGLRSVLILPEVKDSDISTIAPTRDGKPVPTGVITYGHMPLMVTRACPLQNIHDCAHCDKTGLLTDRKAKKFPVRCGLGVRTIYNPVPIYMGDKPGALTVDYGVAYFTLESREEAAAILDSIRQHAPFEGEFTRGLYFKGTN